MKGTGIGIDIGGLRLKSARIEQREDGPQVVASREVDVQPGDRTPQGMIDRLVSLVDSFADDDSPVGIGVAGAIHRPDDRIVKAANYPGWEGFRLAERLADRTGRQVEMENDANLFALAETGFGAAKGRRDVLGITLGTGLGGGVVLGGRLHTGAHGLAGEAGHVVLHPGGEPCGCGSRGCVEQYASTRFLAREGAVRCPDLLEDVEPSRVGEVLAKAGREGHAEARALFEELGHNLGAAVAGLCNVLDVEVVVVGGGLSKAWDLFGLAFDQRVRSATFAEIGTETLLLPATLGGEAGALGAALVALGSE